MSSAGDASGPFGQYSSAPFSFGSISGFDAGQKQCFIGVGEVRKEIALIPMSAFWP